MATALVIIGAAGLTAAPSFDAAALQARLTQISAEMSSKYHCSIAIGVQTGTDALAAASPDINTSSKFVWGSVTKLLTGTALLRAVEKKQISLTDPIAPILDPMLKSFGLGSMKDLFGPFAKFLNARHLAEMRSGVPDYDTAKPWEKPPTDAFRAEVYAAPAREYDPKDILNVSWVATGALDWFPGTRQDYSSTNFVLLGLLLASLDPTVKEWDAYDQLGAIDALPSARRQLYDAVRFGVHGAPSGLTSVHGFDRTSYNHQNHSELPGKDVWNVKGVYGGWTASDITAAPSDTARLAYDIFGQAGPRALTPTSVSTMIPKPGDHFYGFATFNLSREWGPKDPKYSQAYGHLGATYGYQSVVAYFPAADLALSVATNIETDDQIQPADTMCLAYNAILASLMNASEPTCHYVHKGYYGGACECTHADDADVAASASTQPEPAAAAATTAATAATSTASSSTATSTASSSTSTASSSSLGPTLEAALTPILQKMAAKYNCSISVALKGSGTHDPPDVSWVDVQLAAGVTDRGSKRAALPSDPYVWGSVTKVSTGTGVLRLVDAGKLTLDTKVAPIIDSILKKMRSTDPSMNFDKLSDLWGPDVSKITVLHLLGMRSGVPDYDTASPSGKMPTDALRKTCYDNPTLAYAPQQLISFPWVRTGHLLFEPGVCDRHKYFNCYSSTNYVLLGLLLASLDGASSWTGYSQTKTLQPALQDLKNLSFATTGAPSAWTPVKGYDVTKYNHNNGSIDVSNVAGVFAGWTASDIVFTASDAARMILDVYGPNGPLLSPTLVKRMYDESSYTGYGLATFNLTRLTPHDVAYGHLGATYGYQSVVVYIPSLELSLTIGTNLETDQQSQPADTFCSVYNTAKAIILQKPIPTCTYTHGYYSGGCKCK